MQKYVYLAGAILGRTRGEANDWRKTIADNLYQDSNGGVIGISPLRCEPLIGDRYGAVNNIDKRFGTARAISAKNRFDVQNCDVVLAYMPAEYPLSLGTLIELSWADAYGKQAILVSNHPSIIDHPVVDAVVDWKLDTLDEAVDVCIGILGGYTGGKNV